MKTTTQVKLIDNLTSREYEQCRSLCLRENGALYYDLYNYRHGFYHGTKVKFPRSNKPCYVIMIKSEDKRLIAWALMSPEINKTADYLAQFYTRAEFRGQGYGTRLMKQCLKIDPKPWVIPFTEEAAGLFKKYKTAIRFDKKTIRYRELMK